MQDGDDIRDFVERLQRVHDDNSRPDHFARYRDSGREKSTMYVTAFVYEFFLYNTLYEIDWPLSLQEEQLKYHANKAEKEQDAFEDFLCKQSRGRDDLIVSAFALPTEMPVHGDWTQINPDRRIKHRQEGKKFFDDLRELQATLRRLEKHPTEALHDEVFKYLRECRRFVYKVRNNIFHGSKNLGEFEDPAQHWRIEVYYRLVNSIVSLFFHLDVYKQKQTGEEAAVAPADSHDLEPETDSRYPLRGKPIIYIDPFA
ncbi:MAG: hypothetical protein HYR71_07980, partial [Chloroflexi bacterium]|nr:hypothetical protein [Chloroflexota bacterium]